MTLIQYIASLQKMVDDTPMTGDLPVIYSADSEGNGFSKVIFSPSFGDYQDGQFNKYNKTGGQLNVNSVCIN